MESIACFRRIIVQILLEFLKLMMGQANPVQEILYVLIVFQMEEGDFLIFDWTLH